MLIYYPEIPGKDKNTHSFPGPVWQMAFHNTAATSHAEQPPC